MIVENTEFDPLPPQAGIDTAPPAPTVIGKAVAVTATSADPSSGDAV